MANSKYDCTSSKAASSYIPRCNPPYLRDPVVFGGPGLSLAQPRGHCGVITTRSKESNLVLTPCSCSCRCCRPPSLHLSFPSLHIFTSLHHHHHHHHRRHSYIPKIILDIPHTAPPSYWSSAISPLPHLIQLLLSRLSISNRFTLVIRPAINKTTGIRFRRSN